MINKNIKKNLGPIEADIVARLTYEKITIIKASELDRMFTLSPNDRKQLVFRLKRKKILIPIKRGIYLFSPLESGPGGTGIDELLIPPLFFPEDNYYIGYSTMFNYYGFTEQLFQTVYTLNTSKSMKKVIMGISFNFIKIPENRLFGLEKIKIKNNYSVISDKERTLVDLIYFNSPVGGVYPAIEIMKKIISRNECDIKKLIEYTARFPIIITRKRIGLILDKLGINDSDLKPIIKSVKNTSVTSLGTSRKGRLIKKWKVISDDPQA